MEQTNIFDYIDETDDLYVKIENLQYGESMIVDDITIVKYKFYEVHHEDFHEHFRKAQSVVRFITMK